MVGPGAPAGAARRRGHGVRRASDAGAVVPAPVRAQRGASPASGGASVGRGAAIDRGQRCAVRRHGASVRTGRPRACGEWLRARWRGVAGVPRGVGAGAGVRAGVGGDRQPGASRRLHQHPRYRASQARRYDDRPTAGAARGRVRAGAGGRGGSLLPRILVHGAGRGIVEPGGRGRNGGAVRPVPHRCRRTADGRALPADAAVRAGARLGAGARGEHLAGRRGPCGTQCRRTAGRPRGLVQGRRADGVAGCGGGAGCGGRMGLRPRRQNRRKIAQRAGSIFLSRVGALRAQSGIRRHALRLRAPPTPHDGNPRRRGQAGQRQRARLGDRVEDDRAAEILHGIRTGEVLHGAERPGDGPGR